jgi:hypothetical protein
MGKKDGELGYEGGDGGDARTKRERRWADGRERTAWTMGPRGDTKTGIGGLELRKADDGLAIDDGRAERWKKAA